MKSKTFLVRGSDYIFHNFIKNTGLMRYELNRLVLWGFLAQWGGA